MKFLEFFTTLTKPEQKDETLATLDTVVSTFRPFFNVGVAVYIYANKEPEVTVNEALSAGRLFGNALANQVKQNLSAAQSDKQQEMEGVVRSWAKVGQ